MANHTIASSSKKISARIRRSLFPSWVSYASFLCRTAVIADFP
ncbi:Uncharacterised protein [Vibrio cholerae]|nr:Uncharacterised protein [Vibrio cholerae]